jgi:hypothetical protein
LNFVSSPIWRRLKQPKKNRGHPESFFPFPATLATLELWLKKPLTSSAKFKMSQLCVVSSQQSAVPVAFRVHNDPQQNIITKTIVLVYRSAIQATNKEQNLTLVPASCFSN